MRNHAEAAVGRRSALPVFAAGLIAATFWAACSQGPVCKELASCVGSPVGRWAQRPTIESGGKYCQESLHKPPLSEYLMGQPTPVTRMRVPESTNQDWCYNLILTPEEANPLKKNLYYWENLVYVEGLLTYEENGQYQLNFGRTGRVEAYYSRTCLGQYGHSSGCAAFAQVLTEANQGAGEYNDFKCEEDKTRGGCNCTFVVNEADAQSGMYTVQGSTITHYSSTPPTHFTQAMTCVRGDTMELTGLDNSYLWDRPGLRTIEMVRVNCNDGKQGPGELGVDCGLRCPNECPP